MARPGEELSQLWSLVSELTEQLAINQAVVKQLKDRSENVKGQAAHAGAGFPLRRFNVDITDEEFQSEIERFASHLVLENQGLQQENKQLNSLLKEYETTLEQVMGKFRGVAHASQQHDLSLHSYYSSLLHTLQTAHSSAHLHDNTSLSLLLTRLSTLLRSALRSLGGEEPDVDLSALLDLSNLSTHDVASEIGSGGASSEPPSPTKSASSAKKSTASSGKGKTQRSVIQRAPARIPHFPGSLPGSSGGYAGTNGQGDWALEREMEILRLEAENQELRELLGIAEESPAAAAVGEDLKEEDKPEEDDEKAGGGRRKSSLTLEELEAGAELEAAEKERAVEAGLIDKDGNSLIHQGEGEHARPKEPGTGSGGGQGLGEGQNRPILHDGALGFTAEAAPENAIEDEA